MLLEEVYGVANCHLQYIVYVLAVEFHLQNFVLETLAVACFAFELQVGQPKVLDKVIGGQRCEPIEMLTIDVPEEFVGRAIEMATRRKGALIQMENRGDRTHLEFDIPPLS